VPENGCARNLQSEYAFVDSAFARNLQSEYVFVDSAFIIILSIPLCF
jgi:hypothetical protein